MEQEKQVNTGFTRQEIENHLHSALAAATPDLWPELEQAIKAKILTVPDASEREGFADFMPGQEDEGISLRRKGGKWAKKYSWIRRFGAAAAVFVCLLGGGWYHYEYLQIASQVEIDVNPSLKLSLNRRDRVLKVQAQNDDGERLVEGMGLKGKTVQAAVDQVVDSLIEQGYLENGQQEHAVLVSVSGKTPELAEQVKAAVTDDMESALARKEVKAVVYDQVIQVTDELEKLAQTYQVSLGKAEFIGQLVQENVSLSENRQEAYSRMMSQTMEELSGEIDRNSYQMGAGVSVVKTEQALSWIREQDEANNGSGLSAFQESREEKTGDREGKTEDDRQEESSVKKQEEDWFKSREPDEIFERPVSENREKSGEDPENMEKGGENPENLDLRQDEEGQEDSEKTDEAEEKGSGSEAIRRRPQVRDEAEESDGSTVWDETEGSDGNPVRDEAEESDGNPVRDEAEESESSPVQDETEESGEPPVRKELDEEEVPEGEFPAEREGEPDAIPDEEEQETEKIKESESYGEDPDTEKPGERETAKEESEEALEKRETADGGSDEDWKEFETAGAEAGGALEKGEAAEEGTGEEPKTETAKEGAEEKPKEAETGSPGEPKSAETPDRAPEGSEVPEENSTEETESELIEEPESSEKPETVEESSDAWSEEMKRRGEDQSGQSADSAASKGKAQPEFAAPAQQEITEPGQLRPEGEEGANRVIRTGTKVDTFEPGDMAGEREDGQTITSSGTKIIFEAVEKKTWEKPIYASQYLTGSQRSLLQMGPGVFLGRVSLENQNGLLQLGPGFAYLYDNPSADWDESYLWGVRIVPCKGKVYQAGQSGKDELKK